MCYLSKDVKVDHYLFLENCPPTPPLSQHGSLFVSGKLHTSPLP